MRHASRPHAQSRTRLWRAVLLASFVFAAFASQGPLPSSYPPLSAHELEPQLLEHTNAEREREGLPALRHGDALALAARHHAREMAELGYFDHESPTPVNETLPQRVGNAGGAVVRVGENIAQLKPVTEDLAERTVRGWMASDEHRDNLLDGAWTHIGHGIAEHPEGGVVIVQVFAADPNPLVRVEPLGNSSIRLAFEQSPDELVFVVNDAPAQAEAEGREVRLVLTGEPPYTVMTGRPLDEGQIAVAQAFRFTGEELEPVPMPSGH